MNKYKLNKLNNRNSFRRLVSENLTKTNRLADEVNSPLAKYDKLGNLSCVICRTQVKSDIAWKVHVNSKNHKQNVEAAKQLNNNFKAEVSVKVEPADNSQSEKTADKRKETTSENLFEKIPSSDVKTVLPENFFDTVGSKKSLNATDEEEWKRFQKEIKEEYSNSNAIIAGDNDLATVDRQIYEIDEQILMWTRVVSLEKQKKQILQRVQKIKCVDHIDEEESDSCDEYLDWRRKKFD